MKVSNLLHKEGVTASKGVKQLDSSLSTMKGPCLPEHRAPHLFLSKLLGFRWLIPSVFWNPSEWKSSLPLGTALHYSVVLLLMMMIWSEMSSVARYQLDFKVFSISLLSLMEKELFIHLVIHSAYSCLTTLISIMLLESLYKNVARVKVNIYSHP